MIIEGKSIVLSYENDINTDLIIAGKYTKTLDMEELAEHVFEDLDENLKENIKNKIIIVGENFGCGSSREQAPLALLHGGVRAVIAKSYARIFFRNAINIGLPVLTADTSVFSDGEDLLIDLRDGTIKQGKTQELIKSNRMPEIMINILSKGGLIKYLKEEGSF
ncbi:MAG: 3-isopropylmalate dehydratase [Dethiosulfatibacter sp.]|nr:3-isopropylmalate dehydratase [Dethiosulfatibacter sp.]